MPFGHWPDGRGAGLVRPFPPSRNARKQALPSSATHRGISPVLALAAIAAAHGHAAAGLNDAGAEESMMTAESPAPAMPADMQHAPLPALDLSAMRMGGRQGPWRASNWASAFSGVPWRYDRIRQQPDGATLFHLDRHGAPELQGIWKRAHKKGLWEVDVTLPQEAPGLAIAPLWLYNPASRDEIDFEIVGTRGLQVNIHSFASGKHAETPVLLPGTTGWSGRRVRFAIRTDIDAGEIDLLVDGVVVHSYRRDSDPDAFPVTALTPMISMWPAKRRLDWAESWLGKWRGEPATMVVHGYRFTP